MNNYLCKYAITVPNFLDINYLDFMKKAIKNSNIINYTFISEAETVLRYEMEKRQGYINIKNGDTMMREYWEIFMIKIKNMLLKLL